LPLQHYKKFLTLVYLLDSIQRIRTINVLEDTTAIRKHIRHVTGIPIEVTMDFDDDCHSEDDTITNVSLGGLSFIASDRLDIKENIEVRFPIINSNARLSARVVWCEKSRKGYEVGLEFDDPKEVERLKMVEQICQIEKFREEVGEREGRHLTSEQAAREWISHFAGEFSALN
jgi:hypothetical protein